MFFEKGVLNYENSQIYVLAETDLGIKHCL